jgi:uncharacterized Zn finger protein
VAHDTIPCPRCDRLGFVRHETVIKGHEFFTTFYCGGCGHGWKETAPKPPPKSMNA